MSILHALATLLLGTPLAVWGAILCVLVLADAIGNREFAAELGLKYPNIVNGFVICLIYAALLPLIVAAHLYTHSVIPNGLFPLPGSAHGGIALIFDLAIYFFVADFFYYWWHRAQHHFPRLWAWHAVHHSDAHVNATTYVRQHWNEVGIQALVVTIPLLILFGNTKIPLACGWAFTAWNFFIHANRDIGSGVWSRIVTTPNQHRMHHATDEAYHNTNFASHFPLWDIAFGTFAEGRKGPIETGLTAKDQHLRGIQIDMLWTRR